MVVLKRAHSGVTETLEALHNDPFDGGEGLHAHRWIVTAYFAFDAYVDRRIEKRALRRVLDAVPRVGDALPARLGTAEALALHVTRALGVSCIGCRIVREEGFEVELWV